jgi:hypothetical protein
MASNTKAEEISSAISHAGHTDKVSSKVAQPQVNYTTIFEI